MSFSQLVLDTDILSLLMRNNCPVLTRAKEYLSPTLDLRFPENSLWEVRAHTLIYP
jgi:hypothetical protein